MGEGEWQEALVYAGQPRRLRPPPAGDLGAQPVELGVARAPGGGGAEALQ
jgi:hypothetical protein